ncbi:MAG TPA: radical SAM protein [Arenibaculum sp.]|nr:radical SAM protein [Arenibaculum sp.]
MRNDESGPRIAYLLPTGRCNLHCQGCYATLEHWGRHTRKGELSLEDYRRVIAELVDMNVRVFDISGGEPLLYRHLVEVCEAIRSHEGTRIWLVNNGTKLDAAKLERLSGLVERLVVSLDAPYADLHDELRGRKGTFDLALSTLRAARALPFPEVAVNMLVCRPNADSVGDMLALCRREEFDRLSLLSYRDVSENGVMPDMIPDFDALKRGWETAAEA